MIIFWEAVYLLWGVLFSGGDPRSPSPFYPAIFFFIQLGEFCPQAPLIFVHHNQNSNWFFLPSFRVLKNEITLQIIIFWLAVYLFEKCYFSSRVSPFFKHFRFHSAGINSSPESSHFVRHHADDSLWSVRQKIIIFLATVCRPHP